MDKTLNTKVININKTTAAWAAETKIADKGVLLIEFTMDGNAKLKIGDGVNKFSNLPYASSDADLSDYYTKEEIDTSLEDYVNTADTLILNCTM